MSDLDLLPLDERCACGDVHGIRTKHRGRWWHLATTSDHHWRPARTAGGRPLAFAGVDLRAAGRQHVRRSRELLAAGAPVQNSPGRRGRGGGRARSRRSKTPRHAGGRPLAFIPAMVVAEAAKQYRVYQEWSTVLRNLQESGNGTWARNTLIRRVRRLEAERLGHNQAEDLVDAGAGRDPAAPSKTGRRRRRRR